MSKELYTPKEACEILGIHIRTLQRWDNEGSIKTLRTPSGRRRVPASEVNRLSNKESERKNKDFELGGAVYARVSSHEQKQKGDLDRQVGNIMCNIDTLAHSNITVITDVGSGLNDKRKGLMKLMSLAKNKSINKVYINYKDRLTRFGFNYLELYFNSHDVDIVIINNKNEDKTPQQELIDDLMSIITSFSGKLYGMRSGKNSKVTKEIESVLKDNL